MFTSSYLTVLENLKENLEAKSDGQRGQAYIFQCTKLESLVGGLWQFQLKTRLQVNGTTSRSQQRKPSNARRAKEIGPEEK